MTRARSQAKKPDIPDLPVNSAALAWVLNITQRRIQQLAKDGVIPAPVKYQYNLVDCMRGYATFLQKTVEQQGSGSSNADLKKARVELLRTQKKNVDLSLRQKTGRRLEADEVQAVVTAGTAVFVGQKRSMGSRLAGMNDPKAILKLLNAENDKILLELSKKLKALADRANS